MSLLIKARAESKHVSNSVVVKSEKANRSVVINVKIKL